MQFTALALLGMATAATCAAVPELFERSPLCVRGPKHAGDECDPSNWNSKTCGPGNDGNILLCVKNKANDKYHWEVDVHCKPSKSGSGGGCKNCACRLGPA